MSRLRTAPEKRRAALKRDHRTEMEAPHAFRKNWPKKKTRINRNRRRAVDAALQSVLKGADTDAVLVPRRLRGEHLHKVGVAPLASVVARKTERAGTDYLPRYIAPRGNPEEYAEPFCRFLATLLEGRTSVSSVRAAYFSWLLDGDLPNNHPVRYKQVWIRRFFRTHHRWETRVRRWCREAQEQPS